MANQVNALIEKAELLSVRLKSCDESVREELHEQLHTTLLKIRSGGGMVPAGLSQLDHDLTEEEVEDGFDNMPV